MNFVVIKGKKVLLSIIIFFTICVLVFSGVGISSAFSKTTKKLPIYRVRTEEKKIAISFDCAWGDEYTDTLLEIMQEEKVKCTFFMVEFWTKKYSEHVAKINDMGHEIGTHSATHPYMSKLSKEQIIKELTTSSNAITEITNKKIEVFRPPYGDYNDRLIDTAKELGLYTIQWDVDSLDWKNLSAMEIYNRVVKRVKNGSIVLFHNNGLHTAEALPLIIKELKKQGYTFTTIGNLIYKDNYKMAVDGEQISLI